MKLKILFTIFATILVALAVAACSTPSNTTNSTGTTQPASQAADPNTALPLAEQLAIGILKLEETDQAVTAEQADELLNLWQAYQALMNSETTASVELAAVLEQIQETLTAEQVQAIETMGLTRQSMTELMQSLGIEMGGRDPNAQQTPDGSGSEFNGEFQRGSGSGERPEGGGPGGRGGAMPSGGGGAPPDGGMAPGGEMGGEMQATPDASTQATMQARFQAQANRLSPMLLTALIQMLESK